MLQFLNKYFEEILGAILLATMTSIAFINVIVRYFSSFSFAWSEEITTNLFVWIVLLGTACAFRDNTNLAVSLFYNKCPKAFRFFFYCMSMVLSICFFSVLTYTGIFEILDEIELDRVSDSLELPFWLYSGAVPLFSILIIFRIVQRAVRDFANRSL